MFMVCVLLQDMHNVENKAAGAPLHKFIGAFRFGLKAALNRATVEGEFGTLAGEGGFGTSAGEEEIDHAGVGVTPSHALESMHCLAW
jgi:hypothetical protein